MTETASPIEIVWTITMLVGLATSVVNAVYAYHRWRELILSGQNGLVKIMRKFALLKQCAIVGMFLCLTGLGVIALITPPNPSVGTSQYLSGGLFIVLGVLLEALTIGEQIRRKQLRREAEHQGLVPYE